MKFKQLKYKQVELELRQLARTLPAGARLPAERDLAIEYQCSFLTVRKALKHLVDDGLITRRTGSGTFIAQERPIPADGNGRNGDRIGMLVYQKSNAYAFAVFQAIAHAALTEPIELRSCWVRDFADAGLRQAEMLRDEGCCALILPWFPHDMADEIHAFMRRCPLPASLPILIPGLERFCFEEAHLFEAIQSFMEGLCGYFARLGHERIAFLGPDSPDDTILQQKLGTYTCFMSRENRPTLCGMVAPGAGSMDQLAKHWKSLGGDLAIVSYDDEHALRFMTSMHKIGLSAPRDFAIIGWNNIDASHYSDPPLSTVRQNFDYVGRWLMKNALALSKGQVCQASEAQERDLLVRSTCGGRDRIDDAFRNALRPSGLRICLQDDEPCPGWR